jgi:predicted  nucleic acid-binding Zn-ribbon protein
MLSLSVCFPAFSQNTEAEHPTMGALLLEIRQLRHDLQTAAIAARRAQIVIYRLHEQTQAVDRASEKLENSKTALAQMQQQKEYQAEQIKRFEEMRDQAENEQQRIQLESTVARFKEQLEAWEQEEQELRLKVSEQEADLRGEKAKQERLDEQLDQLDRDLEEAAVSGK